MNQVYEKERELHREVAERVESRLAGVEVLAVELRGPEQMAVYVDRPSGVDHALCVEVTAMLREYLGRYSLEVSSPGLERPLRTRAHFSKAVGRKVALRTASDVAGRRRFRGQVVRAGEGAVTLAADDEIDVPYDEIVRGNLIDEG
ncbi:MAG: ribosome maturation factor RimP [Actinobacteria bacterium]|nr:ribosome maturation factor RimP [Actinomycetota bacterium]